MQIENKKLFTCLILFSLSFLLLMGITILRQHPGYMDESYYYLGARNLKDGNGFNERIVWNYLGDPVGLPQPSHLYWMPGASVIGWMGMVVLNSGTYFAACLPFVILGGLVPVLTYLLGLRFLNDQWLSVLAASLAVIGGYYLVYYSAIETFTITMILGCLFLAFSSYLKPDHLKQWVLKGVLLGLLSGLLHMARADGIVWAVIGLLVLVSEGRHTLFRKEAERKMTGVIWAGVTLVLTYMAVMSPWYLRNIRLFSSIGAPGSIRNLFLTQYNDLFNYPASTVSFQNWYQSGLVVIFKDRLRAAGINLLSTIGVQHLVFLLPPVIVAVVKRGKEVITRYFILIWATIFLLMSLVFPYAGSRGGFFHSGSAVQIWIYLYAMSGFNDLLHYFEQKRNWNYQQAKKVLGIGFLVIFILVSVFLSIPKLIGDSETGKVAWSAAGYEFQQIEAGIQSLGIPASEPVLINDPPSNYIFTNRASLVIPNGDERTSLLVMDRYHVNYLVLQRNHPEGLNDLYDNRTSDTFELLFTGEGFTIWQKKP